jgi:hypothetical protein
MRALLLIAGLTAAVLSRGGGGADNGNHASFCGRHDGYHNYRIRRDRATNRTVWPLRGPQAQRCDAVPLISRQMPTDIGGTWALAMHLVGRRQTCGNPPVVDHPRDHLAADDLNWVPTRKRTFQAHTSLDTRRVFVTPQR